MRRLLLAAALAAAAGFPMRVRAQEATGGQVDSVAVTGNRRVTTETILNTFALPLHTPINYRDIQRGIRALFALSQFDDVQVHHRLGDAGASILSVEVKERPLVVRTTIRGADKL